ncbi:sensor histidine kinase [Streptosporangium sandarakinum]|uniref:sensor histidine kinase n=1 Tax=Streptosporangium sandarakinum TaxID=1260955 RepID=UPI0034397954
MTKHSAAVLRGWVRRATVQDTALGAGLLAACVTVNHPQAAVHAAPGAHGMAGLWVWWSMTALIVTGVALRRSRPLPMLALSTAAAGVHLAANVPPMIADLGVLIVLYTVAARTTRTVSAAVLAALLLLVTAWSLYQGLAGLPTPVFRVHNAPTPPPEPEQAATASRDDGRVAGNGVFVLGSGLVAAWAIGSSARNRRAYLKQLRERARDLERERDQQAALAVAAERGRISREMHDVVAHGLSLIVIQAQGAAAALDHRPADTRAALETIVTTGRASLTDMRRALGALGEVDDAWHPQPGLAQLPALLARVRRAGTPVRLRVGGVPATLPAPVDLTAYRIVQEALTNTMKHAGAGASADVVLTYGDTTVNIEVSDDGQGPPHDPRHGNGLRGMHERVKLLGGTLRTGPVARCGFTVRATLPVDEPADGPRA